MRQLVRLALAICVVVALCGSTVAVFAQSGGPYGLSWHNIGPGGASTGGNYGLNAAIGQPDAGAMSGGVYTLSGGFLAAGPACALPGDLNHDGQVTVIDIQMIASAWPQSSATFPYDQNGDGDLDIQDIILVTAQFGDAC